MAKVRRPSRSRHDSLPARELRDPRLDWLREGQPRFGRSSDRACRPPAPPCAPAPPSAARREKRIRSQVVVRAAPPLLPEPPAGDHLAGRRRRPTIQFRFRRRRTSSEQPKAPRERKQRPPDDDAEEILSDGFLRAAWWQPFQAPGPDPDCFWSDERFAAIDALLADTSGHAGRRCRRLVGLLGLRSEGAQAPA
eukprot:TRINITY_DN73675_c0_g1_i1.p1 TRINITY_DN73675_c0_g1~~TRINITY_DN73675_c0_g1_i1.p1  ORF type:complete len:194 (+),score=32.96 TRINITY_DN73675_c0_g1_i1:134-715(+)